jgi:hypothetical protein
MDDNSKFATPSSIHQGYSKSTNDPNELKCGYIAGVLCMKAAPTQILRKLIDFSVNWVSSGFCMGIDGTMLTSPNISYALL